MQRIHDFIQKLENYKYNAVNGNWTTALIIDNDILGQVHHNEIVNAAIQSIKRAFHITSRESALQTAVTHLCSQRRKSALVINEIQKLRQHRFPWVYIRHDHLAYPLVKNILWNVLNRIELKIEVKIK